MYRPSGLTALAVFNFILGGWAVISALLTAVAMAAKSQGQPGTEQLSDGLLAVNLGYLLADAGLLITAGIGYLKMKRVLGRWLGSGEAVFSLIYFGVAVAIVSSEGQPFSLAMLTSLVYPGLTLVLLNVVFRENLVN